MKITKIIVCVGVFLSMGAMAEIAVIVHPSNKAMLTEKQVKDLYLLKERYFPDGTTVQVYNLSGDALAKQDFYRNVLVKDEGRLNSIWVRALFSSKAAPPRDVESAALMKAAVAANPAAIGFINANDVDDSVKVVFTK